MKRSFLFAGMALVASLFMMSCENSGGGSSSGKSSAKLWPAYDETAKQWGYINAQGEWAFAARFIEAREFNGGYALAKTGSVWEFIGGDGNRINGVPAFDACDGQFKNGYVRFQQYNYWGLMNDQLKTVIDPIYVDLGEMSDLGLIAAQKGSSDNYGYIDVNRQQKIEAIYDEAGMFVDGIAIVVRGGRFSGINKSGQTIIQPKDSRMVSLGNGRISFLDTQRRKYGLLDTQGKEIGSPIYSQIYEFTDNGLARVAIDGKYSYITKDGSELSLSNGKALEATDFHEGIAFVKYVATGDFEAIGTDGNRKFNLNKGETPYGYFNGGLCLVWSKDNRGRYFYRYINTNGATVREWIGDGMNGNPSVSPETEPGVTPSNPTDPTDDPSNPGQGGATTMYIKHPWNGGDWTWRPMTAYVEDGHTIYYYKGTWGGVGFNVNTTQSDAGAEWFPEEDVASAMGLTEIPFGMNVVFLYYEYEGEHIGAVVDAASAPF